MKSLESHLVRMHATNVVQEWDGTFKGAIAKLEDALKDFYASETQEYTLENAVESWSKIVCNHPDYVAYETRQLAQWEEAQAKQNAIALKVLREALPQELVQATRISRNRMMDKYGLTRALADRFWRKKVLWLIWMPTAEIAK
eukprot:SAG31_NODE_11347_length_1040_cov_1.492030_1_plen_142_part_10